MNAILYNVLLLAMVAGSLGALWVYLRHHDPNPGRDLSLACLLTGLLVIASLAGALLWGGDSFGTVQLLAWSGFLYAPLFLLGLGFLYRQRRPPISCCAIAVALCIGLIAGDAFLLEPQWLEITHVEVASPKLSESVRVVILADVQTDHPGAYEARVLEAAMAEHPDLILFAGDYIQPGRRSRSYEEEMAALRGLLIDAEVQAPLGAYAIAGNVDRPGRWTEISEGLPIATIEHTTRYDLGPVVITGLDMSDAFGTTVSLGHEEKFHIVLGHSPNFSLAPVGGDLLIAGHTHGGQVQIPFLGPILTLSAVPRGWASGVTQIDSDTTLIVSRGIGLERGNAPRMRFLCRPELVVVDLVPD